MRENKELLFMGQGNVSRHKCRRLKRRLADALSLLSGLQQGVPIDSDEYVKAEGELIDLVKDIGAALLGHEVYVGRALPYKHSKG